jgi:hypothetical protein
MSQRHDSLLVNLSSLTVDLPRRSSSLTSRSSADVTTSLYPSTQYSERPPSSTTTATTTTTDLTPPDTPDQEITPRSIAIKRTVAAQQRLAQAHEGWLVAARALCYAGVIPDYDQGISSSMQEFGDAIVARYAAARFLHEVLVGMPQEDWFGPKKKFDATLRRLKTLKGLEGSLMCWEGLLLEMLEVVDKIDNGGGDGVRALEGVRKEELCREMRRVLGRWRRGMPSRP